jgi:hypothetical protein
VKNLGIDFGTTNSSAAFQRAPGQAPECVPVDRYSNLPFDVVLRTAVLLDESGRVVPNMIGAAALDPINHYDPQTKSKRRILTNIKPFLKTFRLREVWPVIWTETTADYDHLRQEPMVMSYKAFVETGDLECSREELMNAGSAVFRQLFVKTPALALSRETQIVVGIPLIFPDYAKKRLIDIVVRTGVFKSDEPYREALQRIRFLPEPIGASLLYGLELQPQRGKSSGRVLVFDSGGGTLDLALLEFATIEGSYRPVRQLALNSQILAGRRFDESIEINALAEARSLIRRANSNAVDPDSVANSYTAQAAELIKIELSTRESVEQVVPGTGGFRVTVKRADFEVWCRPLLVETEVLIRSTVSDLDAVNTVIMVGGSSLIPCVQRLVRQIFPKAEVLYEDAGDQGRGGGVERALTAVSKGLALYDEAIASQGITPFGYGFWDAEKRLVVPAVERWSSHISSRPVVSVSAPPTAEAMTLTVVQDLVTPERVLNIVNVPVHVKHGQASRVKVRIRTTDGSLYPDIELLNFDGSAIVDRLAFRDVAEHTLKQLIKDEDHVIYWPGTRSTRRTPYAEVVSLRKGDPVIYTERCDFRRRLVERKGVIVKIHRIADGLPYDIVDHWDLTRWRFYIHRSGGVAPFVPLATTDIRLDRTRRKPEVAE